MNWQLVCDIVFPSVIALALTVCLGVSGIAADASAKSPDAFRFSVGPNLFVDDYLIAKSEGLKRTTHQPEKLPEPVLRRAESWHLQPQWFLEVKRDPITGKFRAWYNVKNPGGAPYVCNCYAESDDGIKWVRPELGLVEAAGSKKNSIIDAPLGHFGLFLVDEGPSYANKSRRYKMAYFGPGLAIAFSEDGLRWKEYEGNPVLPMDEGDTKEKQAGIGGYVSDIIEGCWDPIKQEYMIACKVNRNGHPGTPPHNSEGYRRLVSVTTSKDFLLWHRPELVMTPDPANGLEEFYGMKPMVRGNLYLGFLRVLRDDLPADAGGPVEGIGWTELATSREGRNWTRYQDKFIDRNPKPGTWDHAMGWFADCVTVGDKDYVYYGGYSAGHKVGDREVGLAILRKNGFVSRDAGSKAGLLKTPLAQLPGKSITVNAVVRGELKVRVVDAKGKALKGFDWPDCAPIRGDSVAHPIKWRSGKNLPTFQQVSLEFSIRDGELYGFDLGK